MATGGIFQLITNDGKQDRMLMATELLKKRIAEVTQARSAAHQADTTPTLYDIERTHIIFTNAHFKPFAAIGYEYNKVSTTSGSPALGSSVIFSIPQFGDFFHDMVLHVTLTAPTMNYGTTAASDQSLVRWCSYPGERLISSVKFDVNGNPLDEYTTNAMNFHREFQVAPNKRAGWNRLVGQQDLEDGWVSQPNWAGSGVAASAITYATKVQTASGLQTPSFASTESIDLFIPLMFWCNRDPRLSVPSVAIPYGQRFITVNMASADKLCGVVFRGVNTDAAGQPEWKTSEAANSGGVLTAPTIKTCFLYINNIFVNPEVHNIFIKRIGFTLIRVHREQTTVVATSTSEVLLQNLKWPIEALFVGLRVKEYYEGTAAQTRQHLDKWHRFSKVTNTARPTQGWQSQRAKVLYSGTTLDALPGGVAADTASWTAATANANYGTQSTVTFSSAITAGAISEGDVLTVKNAIGTVTGTVVAVDPGGLIYTLKVDSTQFVSAAAVSTAVSLSRSVAAEQTAYVQTFARTVDAIIIKAHGIPIYNEFPAQFFNAYLPYHYGGPNINTPDDIGAMMITFCLYPGSYQPSGHINVSRAREFYITYTSSVIDGTTNGILVVLASAINFLLISDGSAVLRYST
jgi:hypothetical protein